MEVPGNDPATSWSAVRHPVHYTNEAGNRFLNTELISTMRHFLEITKDIEFKHISRFSRHNSPLRAIFSQTEAKGHPDGLGVT